MSESLLKYFDWQSPRRSLLEEYAQFDASAWEHMLRTRGENFWQKAGERRALELFRAAAAKVPAYKDFLRKEKVRPGLIKTARDFAKVPPTDKKNYTDRYDLAARSWGGNLSQAKLIAVSSGTTGAPKFWPRSHYQEFEAAVIHELLYRYLLGAEKQRTLVMIGFPMGVYVSGVATLLPSWLAASKMGVALMSIGNNRMEMIRAVENLHKNFERVILVGHPFFIKDVITTGRERGVPWEKIQPRMMFCSEGFNEVWREHLAECAGLKGPRQRENMIITKPAEKDTTWRGKKLRRGARVWPVGSDTGKDALYQRLALTKPGPGYIHTSSELPDEWYKGLTAETLVRRYVRGRPRSEWVLKKGQRNEPLDLWVYGYAALAYLNRHRWKVNDWAHLAEQIEPPLFDPAPPDAPIENNPPPAVVAAPSAKRAGGTRRRGRMGSFLG